MIFIHLKTSYFIKNIRSEKSTLTKKSIKLSSYWHYCIKIILYHINVRIICKCYIVLNYIESTGKNNKKGWVYNDRVSGNDFS